MKNILVVMPVQEAHRRYLEEIGAGCRFTYADVQEVTLEQVCDAEILFGNPAPQLVAQSRKLKWLQLNSSGADAYCKPGVLQPGTLLTCATGGYGLTVSEGLVAMSYVLCRKLDLLGERT